MVMSGRLLDVLQKEQSLLGKTINRAGIPCVAWAEIVLELMGCHSRTGDYTFVVADDQIEKAKEALLTDAAADLAFPLEVCSVENCRAADPWYGLVPDEHLHISLAPTKVGYVRPLICLFRQSRLLWALPPIDNSLLPPPFGDEQDMEAFRKSIGSHFAISTDIFVWLPRIYEIYGRRGGFELYCPWDDPNDSKESWVVDANHGYGVWSDHQYPVVAPLPHLVIEAYIRFDIRHFFDVGITGSLQSIEERTSLGKAHKKERYLDISAMDHIMYWHWLPDNDEKKGVREQVVVTARHLGERRVAREVERDLARNPTCMGW